MATNDFHLEDCTVIVSSQSGNNNGFSFRLCSRPKLLSLLSPKINPICLFSQRYNLATKLLLSGGCASGSRFFLSIPLLHKIAIMHLRKEQILVYIQQIVQLHFQDYFSIIITIIAF